MSSSEMYCPVRGDIIWLDLNPTKGHEQSGHKPVLVLSDYRYNIASGLFIGAPITHTIRHNSWFAPIPDGLTIEGFVISDQLFSKAWKERSAKFICKAPAELVDDVWARFKIIMPD